MNNQLGVGMDKSKVGEINDSFLVYCPPCQELVPIRYNEHLIRQETGAGKSIYLVQCSRECSKCGITLFAQVAWRDYPPEGVGD